VKILGILWKSEVKLSKMDAPEFRNLVEQAHVNTGGRHGLKDQQPVLREMMMNDLKRQMKGRMLALMPDGSKVNMNAEAMVARYLKDDDDPTTVLVAVHKVSKGFER
jgi:hypothetical protein